MKAPLLGPAYVARSSSLANNRCVNLYAEAAPSDTGDNIAALYQVPGLATVSTSGATPSGKVTAWIVANSLLYFVAGGTLYSCTSGNVITSIGVIGAATSMADNGEQLCINTGHVYTYATSTLTPISSTAFVDGGTLRFMDGYFLYNDINTGIIRSSGLYDGTTWDDLAYATAEGASDNVITHIVDHREWWVFGDNSVEVWYNAGTTGFPFARLQGAFIETGCAAVNSVANADSAIFWLSKDARGQGIVYTATSFNSFRRISTHAIEHAIEGYSTISDAIGFCYQQEGHLFYVLTFPTAGKTWCYDVTTGLWHERANYSGGDYSRWRPNLYAYFNGHHLVADWEAFGIYEIDLDTHANGSEVLRWLRSFRIPSKENKRIRFKSIELKMDVGRGLTTGQGSNPQVMMRFSDDGGKTWSNEYWSSSGEIGEYETRVIWRRLGMARDRIFEFSGSDPVRTALVSAFIEAE